MEYRLGNKVLIGFIVLLSMFGPISTDMFLPELDTMVKYFHTDPATMNIALYIFMFMMALSVLFLGTFSDKYGRRIVLALSMALYIAMNILCALTDNITVFLIGRALEGVGGGGALAISMALQKDFFEGEQLNRVITITVALGIIGPIVSPVIGNAIILVSDWKWTFIAPAIVGAICLALALMLPKEIPLRRFEGSVVKSVTGLTRYFRNKSFVIFMVMISIFMGAQLGYVAVASYIYKDDFGFDTTQFSFAMAGSLIIAVFVMLILKHYENRIGKKRVIFLLPCGCIFTAIVLFAAGDSHWWVFTIAMIPMMIMTTFGRSFGYNILLNEYDTDHGSVSSFINFMNYMFCCAGMILATATFWPNYITAIAGISAICAGIYILMGILYKVTGCKLRAL